MLSNEPEVVAEWQATSFNNGGGSALWLLPGAESGKAGKGLLQQDAQHLQVLKISPGSASPRSVLPKGIAVPKARG